MSEDLPSDISEDILKVRESPSSVCPGVQSLKKLSFHGSSSNKPSDVGCSLFSGQTRGRPLEGNLEIGKSYLIVDFLEVFWPEVLSILSIALKKEMATHSISLAWKNPIHKGKKKKDLFL